MANDARQEIIDLTSKLLESIGAGDWKTYSEMCDPQLTCFEPEAQGSLVEGMAFHKFYFDLTGTPGPRNTTLAAPHVWLLSADAAVIAYVRLVQRLSDGSPVTARFEETRVWHRQNGKWRHVHFHRSAPVT